MSNLIFSPFQPLLSYSQQDTGNSSCIRANQNGIIVEFHQSDKTGDYSLWYHVGIYDSCGNVSWSASTQYDKGNPPALAINDNGLVFEVHESNNVFSSSLYCNIGNINSAQKIINFQRQFFELPFSGKNPKIALNNSGLAVIVYESSSKLSAKLFYSILQVNSTGNITVVVSDVNYDSGVTPTISINNNNEFIEVHQAEGLSNGLWFRSGSIDLTNRILNFNQSQAIQYDYGSYPDVLLSDSGLIIELHKSQTYNTLWFHQGYLLEGIVNGMTNNAIQIQIDANSINGCSITLGQNSLLFIGSLQSSNIFFSSSVSLISTHAWMSYIYSTIADKQLFQLILPGTHDSGTYYFDNSFVSNWIATQSLNILEQLQNGIRYFDLRFTYSQGNFYIYHGTDILKGSSLLDIISQVKLYLDNVANQNELVVLTFSHFNKFTQDIHQQFINQIQKEIGNYLCNQQQSNLNLMTSVYSQILNNKQSTVIVLYDVASDDTPQESLPEELLKGQIAGFFLSNKYSVNNPVNIYNQYSNTTDVSTMEDDQLQKLNNNGCKLGNSSKLFLLSWTLTQQFDFDSFSSAYDTIIHTIFGSIESLAESANESLFSFVNKLYWNTSKNQYDLMQSNLVNIIYVDYCQTSSAVSCAILLNTVKS